MTDNINTDDCECVICLEPVDKKKILNVKHVEIYFIQNVYII